MNIQQLLEKFYEGISTPEEERFLKEYFMNVENVDDRWKDDQQLFRFLNNEQIEIPAGVSKRLEKSIREMEKPQHVHSYKPTLYHWVSSIAAIALVCAGLFFATREPEQPGMADTFSNPEEAAIVAEQTLAFMSTQLNRGLNKVADAEQEMHKVNQILNKHLK